MRNEQAQAKRGPKGGLMGAVMGLTLGAGVFLTLLAPTEVASSPVEVAPPEAAAWISPTPDSSDSISPCEEVADSDSLGLQLD